MKMTVLTLGVCDANCYLIKTEKDRGIVIDPGGEPERILTACEAMGMKPALLLCTHGHFDHVTALTPLKQATGAEICIHQADEELLKDPSLLGRMIPAMMPGYKPAPADRLLQDGQLVTLDEVTLRVFHTPGHSAGSCCFLSEDMIFTGDTLFAGSIGRTDLYGGSMGVLRQSLSLLRGLPGDLKVLPGHGEATTLSYERSHNPYLRT